MVRVRYTPSAILTAGGADAIAARLRTTFRAWCVMVEREYPGVVVEVQSEVDRDPDQPAGNRVAVVLRARVGGDSWVVERLPLARIHSAGELHDLCRDVLEALRQKMVARIRRLAQAERQRGRRVVAWEY